MEKTEITAAEMELRTALYTSSHATQLLRQVEMSFCSQTSQCTLSGRVPSHYAKQLAQETIRPTCNLHGIKIVNNLDAFRSISNNDA